MEVVGPDAEDDIDDVEAAFFASMEALPLKSLQPLGPYIANGSWSQPQAAAVDEECKEIRSF